MTTTSAVLIVNDHEPELLALQAALSPLGETILVATSAAEGIRLAEGVEVAVAVLDIHMPLADGFAAAETLRRNAGDPNLPIVFVSAFEPSPETLLRIYALRCADFVLLPAAAEALRSKVAVFAELQRLRQHSASRVATTTLQPSGEQLRLLTQAVSDYALFFLDPVGIVSEWTVSAEHLFGFSTDDIGGKPFGLIFTLEDRTIGAPEQELAIATREGQSNDERDHVRADGTRFPATGRLVALRDPLTGVLRGFAKIVWDATNLRRLEENERKFREIFETANEGIWILNANMRIEAVNQRMAEITGYAIGEMLGRSKPDFVFPEDEPHIRALFEERRLGRMASSTEIRFRHRNGHAVWTLLSARPMFREGRFAGALDMFTDITERKHTEMELEESRTRLRLAIEAADLGVFYHDGHTDRDTWNDRAKQLLGLLPEAEVSLAVFLHHVHPDDRTAVESTFMQALSSTADEQEFAFECRVVISDRSLRYLAINGASRNGAAPNGPQRAHVVGTVRDITAAKQFELQLQRKVDERTRELLEKTNQLESFCYTVAHDLRAPLRAINGFATIISEDFDTLGRSGVTDYLKRITTSTHRLDALIRDLLAYSRITDVELTPGRVDLCAAVNTALGELHEEIADGSAVVSVPEDLPAVWGEKALVEQILVNLLANAVKFTSPGQPARVEITAEDLGDSVQLSVRDHGIGIAPEYHRRIFRVFERLQAAQGYPGTGIGLAIVAKGIQRLGGRCGVDSAPGQGSTFWFVLPKPPHEPSH